MNWDDMYSFFTSTCEKINTKNCGRLAFIKSRSPSSIFPFLKYIFSKEPLSWPKTSAMSCSGSIRASWNMFRPSNHTWAAATRIYARYFFFEIQFLAPNIATNKGVYLFRGKRWNKLVWLKIFDSRCILLK